MAGGAQQPIEIQTVRLPLIGNPLFRGTTASKDQDFINVYFDVLKNQITNATHYYMVKRPGLLQNIQPSGGAAVGRGYILWKGDRYSVFGTQIYKNTTNLGVTLGTSTGLCGMVATRPGAAVPYLGINDGTTLYVIDVLGNVTTVTTNFPNPNTTDLVVFDQYMCTADVNGVLYSCTADDPTTWSTDNAITAQMKGGAGIGLSQQGRYVMVLTDNSTQFFYDAANPSGSPFTNDEFQLTSIGAISQNSIAEGEGTVVFVSTARKGGYTVSRFDDTKLSECGTPALDRILNAEGTNITKVIGKTFRVSGHFFYMMKLIGANRTFVYDIKTNLWTEWQVAGGTTAWPIVSLGEYNGSCIAQGATDGWLYTLSETTYQDNTVNFTWLARFARLDLDDNVRKFYKSAEIIGDIAASTCNISLQYSDDDWATLSTARTLDVSKSRAFTKALGQSRRRSWQLSAANNVAFRAEALELKIRLGSN